MIVDSTRTVEQSLLHSGQEQAFTMALGPTQPPVRWLPGSERPGRGAHHSCPSNAEVKNE